MVTLYNEERDLRMAVGDSVELSNYTFVFKEMRKTQGPNFTSDEGVFELQLDGRFYSELAPQKRFYTTSQRAKHSNAPPLYASKRHYRCCSCTAGLSC